MNATTDAPPETPQAAPAKFVDVLPVRGGNRIALEWLPHVEEMAHGEGFVVLTSKRDRTAYSVAQYPGESMLLGFAFTKVGGKVGTDRGRNSYILTCTRNGNDAKCDCRGFERHGACKHADALETLFLNKWL